MTNRERFLSILSGKSPDRIPWAPRLKYWYNANVVDNTFPDRLKGLSLREVEKAIGASAPAREAPLFRIEYDNLDVVVKDEGLVTTTEFVTPKGRSRWVEKISEDDHKYGFEKVMVEHPLKNEDDYDIWMYIIDNITYVPMYEEFLSYDKEIGDDGLPGLNQEYHCPFHYWLKDLAGYNEGYYHLADFPLKVEALVDLMNEKDKEMWRIVAESPIKLVHHGKHQTPYFTPPNMYDKYITPYYQGFSKLLHEKGKYLAMHADGDTKQILDNIKEAGYDMVECFLTDPMATITLEEARDHWGMKPVIWGGIPSAILEKHFPEDKFREYILNIFRTIAPGDGFILGIADNAMPATLLSRLEWISEMVEKYGYYPIAIK